MFACTIFGTIFVSLAASCVTGFVNPSNDNQRTMQTAKLQECGVESQTTCPDHDHGDFREWKKLTRACCEEPSVFHCQESTDESGQVRIVRACVPKVTCSAGTHAILGREKIGDEYYAWVECKKCAKSSGFYEDTSKDSYLFRHNHCSSQKTICNEEYNKVPCYDGGAAEDDKCRCMHERNYAPSPIIPECFCFGVNSHMCHVACTKTDCLGTLEENYMCEDSVPVTQDRDSDKTVIKQDEHKSDVAGDENVERSSEEDDREYDTDHPEDGNKASDDSLVSLPIIFIVLLVCGIVVYCLPARTKRCLKKKLCCGKGQSDVSGI